MRAAGNPRGRAMERSRWPASALQGAIDDALLELAGKFASRCLDFDACLGMAVKAYKLQDDPRMRLTDLRDFCQSTLGIELADSAAELVFRGCGAPGAQERLVCLPTLSAKMREAKAKAGLEALLARANSLALEMIGSSPLRRRMEHSPSLVIPEKAVYPFDVSPRASPSPARRRRTELQQAAIPEESALGEGSLRGAKCATGLDGALGAGNGTLQRGEGLLRWAEWEQIR